jgi:hypothetical protein
MHLTTKHNICSSKVQDKWNTMNNETSWLETKNIQSFYSQQKSQKQQPSFYPNALVQLSQKCVTFHQCKRYGAKDENKKMCKHVKEVAKF